MIELLFLFLGFLVSLPGLVALGLGLVTFLVLPVIPKATGVCHGINKLYLYLATASIRRAAIVVSEHNDAIFKTMQFDARGVELITLDGVDKDFEDPDGALHHWLGLPFALADETHGVLFDPRHAALGQRKHDYRERDEDSFHASTSEWQQWDVETWKPGVFQMPKTHELVDLSKVREIIEGGERSENPRQVEELYKNSRIPFQSALPAMKLLMPAIAFVLVFGGMWLVITKIGGGGGGSSSTISFGSTLILAALKPEDIDWREVGVIAALTVLPLVGLVLLTLLTSPLIAFAFAVAFGVGFTSLPVVATLSRPITPLAGALSKLFFTLGFLGYRQPVFKWTPERYELVEYESLDTTSDVTWYGLFKTVVGFTYEPDESAWGAEVLEKSEIEARKVSDDERADDSNLPPKYDPVPSLRRDVYGPFVPSRLSRTQYYLHSGIALSRFRGSATGGKSLRRLTEAKEKGEESLGISDKTLLYATCAGGLLGAVLGAGVFLL